ncbi:aldose epimerase family protein [Stutzerimonas nitrititolerans]|uniref:aldose epimerase family protein n=1 Tax=Stutzerimonas nitrititolerans TaxID=2482751 RepID=UPI0007186EA8|nr:aldose epimerase family protein [Stutzerimonas nitrititolerans]KRW69970.1 aldose epimerase [Pseudomonas sp. TTU2014-096BSC]WAD27559.1 galactose mutarotase [Pseudomonadaceae bacterium T75]
MKPNHLLSGIGLALMMSTLTAHAELTNEQGTFGQMPDGTPIEKYTLKNSNGVQATIITYGGILQALVVPDKNGKGEDIVLGFDDVDGYIKNGNVYFGATIGRFGNRIAEGRFELDGNTYQIPQNDGANALHGGPEGFDTKVWKAKPSNQDDSVGVELSYVSADGEMGFPGTLTTHVTYSLNEDNELRIEYRATTDKPTVLNLTNHAYFNLAGAGNGTILDQVATLHASHYTPVTEKLIPTGELAPVAGTPMDFLKPTPFGQHIKDDHQQLKYAEPKQGGFDFNWVLDTEGDVDKLAAEVSDPKSGRVLQLYTSEPGVQLYTSNFLDGSIKGKGGKTYPHWSGFTLETQHFPDAPNQPNFASTRLDPDQTYTQTSIYKFPTP